MMMKHLQLFKYLSLAFIFLSIFINTPTKAQAEGFDFFPRLSVNASNNGSKRLIDNYIYIGTAIGKKVGVGGGLEGLSIKFGFGKTGKKANLSWFMGSGLFSYEAGVSYFQQDSNSTLLINPDGKGFALEGSIRFGILIMNGIVAKDASSLEFGLGF